MTPTDSDALGVRPNVHFTATPTKCWLKARYEGHAHDEPGEPDRQALTYRAPMEENPADAALDLLVFALLDEEARGRRVQGLTKRP